MFDFETTVAGIEHKVRLLADEVARLWTALYEKEDQFRDMEKALENKEILINNLKEENKIIKLGNKLAENGNSTELKLKINQMIRAIDKSLEIIKNQEI